jgi:sporulation protein YlmC with PRC-barrel domain
MISRWIPCLAMIALALPAVSAAAAEPFEFGSASAVTKAGELKGRVVETRDGEELGRIHDFAVDLESGRIAYVVVSVGSFLIEDSLIAVAPGALRESADADRRLVLETDAASLRKARRFAARGNWPTRADVLAAAGEREGAADPAPGGAEDERQRRGTATISDGNRTATLSAGERSIRFEDPPRTPPGSEEAAASERPAPGNRFERLDSDGDGVLNRAEIAHELSRSDSYSDIDLDGSGGIDPDEFDELLESRGSPDDEAPSR